MNELNLTAHRRPERGKQQAKKMRRGGQVPAVLYGHGQPALSIFINSADLIPLFKLESHDNVIINLELAEDKRKLKALLRQVQTEPLRNTLLHMDFQEILLTEKIKINVPVVITGEPTGVKNEGGSLEQILHSVEVSCLPTEIPERIVVDVSGLKLGQTLHISDIKLEKGELHGSPTQPVVSVLAPKAEPEPVAAEGAVAAVAAVAETAPKEPELVAKKKKEAEEEV
jgi:large subunit ribosomal protein L25